MIQLLQDVHTHTWMQVPGSNIPIITRKGTRPGSPLADCIFHILMASVADEINDIMASNQEFRDILARADLHVESVIWADDIALPIASDTAAGLVAAIEHTFQQVHEVFNKRGFTLNLQKGKTSVVATFRGVGAPAMRARHQLVEKPGLTIELPQGPVFCAPHAALQTPGHHLQLWTHAGSGNRSENWDGKKRICASFRTYSYQPSYSRSHQSETI